MPDCLICYEQNNDNDFKQCFICNNKICCECFNNILKVSVENNDNYISICPFCNYRNIIHYKKISRLNLHKKLLKLDINYRSLYNELLNMNTMLNERN